MSLGFLVGIEITLYMLLKLLGENHIVTPKLFTQGLPMGTPKGNPCDHIQIFLGARTQNVRKL